MFVNVNHATCYVKYMYIVHFIHMVGYLSSKQEIGSSNLAGACLEENVNIF